MTHYTKGTLSGRKGPPTDCRRPVSETVSLPSSGCFSPFPHGTGSLSVSKEYLALEGGPPMFRQNFTCSALLNTSNHASYTGLSPISPSFPTGSSHIHCSAGPGSLATTTGVSIDFLSSGYLDVSAHLCRFWVRTYILLTTRSFMVSWIRENFANAKPFLPRAGSRHYDTPPPSNS